MSYMSPELKLRTLASENVTLQGYLGTNPFRWFDRQVAQRYFSATTPCVRYRRISTTPTANNVNSLCAYEWVRLQIDVLHVDGDIARTIAEAVAQFICTGVDLTMPNQFGSPPTQNAYHRAELQNWLDGMEPTLNPPAYVQVMDFRIPNRTDIPA